MWEWLIIALLVILIVCTYVYAYRRGFRKGTFWVLSEWKKTMEDDE